MSGAVPNCAIQLDVEEVAQVGDDLADAMHRLRQDMAQCRGCPVEACSRWARFSARVQAALTTVTDEWSLEIDILEF